MKAFEATNTLCSDDILDILALRVSSDIQDKIMNNKVYVEDIQDSAEKILSETGYTSVAKAYILYRKERENSRNAAQRVINYKNIINSY